MGIGMGMNAGGGFMQSASETNRMQMQISNNSSRHLLQFNLQMYGLVPAAIKIQVSSAQNVAT